MQNPLLKPYDLPPFHLLKTKHLLPALNQKLEEHRSGLEKLLARKSGYTWKNFIEPLENLNEKLQNTWSILNHLNMVTNSPTLRKVYDVCLPKMCTYRTELGQNTKLYQAFLAIFQSREYKNFNYAQQKIIENALRDFRLAGVNLEGKDRLQFKALQKKLSKLQTEFSNNVLDATNAWQKLILDPKDLSGLPDHILIAAKEAAKANKKKGFLLTLHSPFLEGVLTYAENHALRKEIYLAFIARCSKFGQHNKKLDNTKLITEILNTRHCLAKLLKFKNYAEVSLATKTVKDIDTLITFLNKIAAFAKKKATLEIQELKKFSKQNFQINKLEPWDIAYYTEKLRQTKYHISDNEIRNYFPEQKVLTGTFALLEKLFSIKIRTAIKAPVWHPQVRLLEILDITKKPSPIIGKLYLDLYTRSSKQGGAWMDVCRNRCKIKNKTKIPIAYLITNFPSPSPKAPSYLTHNQVETLFHELGHCLQHLLTKIDYPSVSSINSVPFDVVEFPSQFMEHWTFEESVLKLISQHKETLKPLDHALFKKMLAAKNMQSGIQTLKQIEYGLFDLCLHAKFNPKSKNQLQKILTKIRKITAVLPIVKQNAFPNSFLHIFSGDYAAGYYVYKWSEVLASDAFAKFKATGLFNKGVIQNFYQHILSQGGAIDPVVGFKKFRGRAPQVQALLKYHGIKTR